MSVYATTEAIADAAALGLTVSQSDFRDVMLAITDAVLGKGDVASFIGPTRTAERWGIKLALMPVEVIYDPGRAILVRVQSARPGAPAPAVAPLNPGPTRQKEAVRYV